MEKWKEMRKKIAVGLILALVTMTFAAIPMKVNAAEVTKITPSKGKVGNTAVIHGSALSGSGFVVKFGQSQVQDVKPLNDKAIRITIPNRHAIDANPVKVTVTIDGNPATGDLEFLYDPSGPEPIIESVYPPEAEVGAIIGLTVIGTDFMTPQGRMPDQVFLFGPETIQGFVIGEATATSFNAEFPPAAIPGIYLIVVGFSDGSGASHPLTLYLLPP